MPIGICSSCSLVEKESRLNGTAAQGYRGEAGRVPMSIPPMPRPFRLPGSQLESPSKGQVSTGRSAEA